MDKPIVEIFRENGSFRVVVGGEEIQRLRGFTVSIKNLCVPAEYEAPYYTVEKYLPADAEGVECDVFCNLEQNGE